MKNSLVTSAIWRVVQATLCTLVLLPLAAHADVVGTLDASGNPPAYTEGYAGGYEGGPSATPAGSGKGYELSLGVNLEISSSAYKSTTLEWTPLPLISFESERFYVRGFDAGLKLFTSDVVEISTYLNYDMTDFRGKDSGDTALQELDSRYSSVYAGLNLTLNLPLARLYGKAAIDTLGHSKGIMAETGIATSWENGPLEIIPMAGLRYTNHRYNNYYYGVTHEESRESGLAPYRAGSGVEPFAGVALNYSVTEAIEALVSFEMGYLPSSVRDSPMVNKKTSSTMNVGLTYTF